MNGLGSARSASKASDPRRERPPREGESRFEKRAYNNSEKPRSDLGETT